MYLFDLVLTPPYLAVLPGTLVFRLGTHSRVPMQQRIGRKKDCSSLNVADVKMGSVRTGDDGSTNADEAEKQAKVAVAAKISAARTLARKLAEEKEAAAAASKLALGKIVDPEQAQRLIDSAEQEVSQLAKEAAKADAIARAAQRAESGAPQLLELARLKAANQELQALVVQLAVDRKDAESKLDQLRSKFKSALPSPPAPPPSASVDTPQKESDVTPTNINGSLQQLAQECYNSNTKIFSVPPSAVQVGSVAKVYYDRSRGPLPSSNSYSIKIGWNKWEAIDVIPMQHEGGLQSNGDWWSVELKLPSPLFRADFVIVESNSGAVDNNGAKDFSLALSGAISEEDLISQRLEAAAAFEAAAKAELAAEEDKIFSNWMASAQRAAEAARANYRETRKAELLTEARSVVAERRGAILSAISTSASITGVFQWIGGAPSAGASAKLAYNKAAGPLSRAGSLMVHVGYDNWWMKDMRSIPMTKLSDGEIRRYALSPDGDWWCASLSIFNTAAIIDFVVSDVDRKMWDNNNGQDYHTRVMRAASGDKLVELIYSALESATSKSELKKNEDRAAASVMERAAAKGKSARRRREMQQKYIYTKPLVPVAGRPVEVFYNPDKTPLRGRLEVYCHAGFNRWGHPQKTQPGIQMKPVVDGGLGFLTAKIDIPRDAHWVDMVFSDSPTSITGGFVDNNRGVDYHVRVSGAEGVVPTLRVAHVASEMAPIAKAGGLGDVVTALGRAVSDEGHDVEIVLPKYDCINYADVDGIQLIKEFNHENTQVKVWQGRVEGLVTTFLEPCNGLFWVGKIYTDMNQDRHRFGVFSSCAVEYLKFHSGKSKPDVIHAHDWQSAPCCWLDRGGAAAAFTIHNLNYGADLIGRAMTSTDVATTVSPTYAEEISGNPVIAPHHTKFYGIRNGIDPEIWNPADDKFLPCGYTSLDMEQGKAAAKAELRKRMNLFSADVPVVGCVTRLTHQKGIHLIKHAAWRTLERGGQFVLLGSAPDPKVQSEFDALSNEISRQYPDRAKLWYAYDEPLSHLIYAGSDMLLVPSMFEPCGLTQMIAMRYGTVPVVRKTGGLADTVMDIDNDTERAKALGLSLNGFSFEGTDAPGLDYALNRALSLWYAEQEKWNDLARAGMQTDWSWSNPALDYLELYHKITKI